MANPDFLFATEDGFLEVKAQIEAEVIPPHRPAASSATTGPPNPASSGKPTKEGFKNVGEAPHIAHTKIAEAWPPGGSRHTGFAKAIVPGPHFWLREHFVGSVNFLKPLFCPRLFVHVGVILPS